MLTRKKLMLSLLAASLLATSPAVLPPGKLGGALEGSYAYAEDAAAGELPSSVFLGRMNKLHEALAAGDPIDVQEVRDARSEIAALNFEANEKLLDPVWNKLVLKLSPETDQAALKQVLFALLRQASAARYDSTASDLEAIRTNPEYRAAIKTIAAAGGVTNVTMDDFLIMLFGDGNKRLGIEGTVQKQVKGMKAKELSQLLAGKGSVQKVLTDAIADILGKKDEYPLSKAFVTLGIKPDDVRKVVVDIQAMLAHEEAAGRAMMVAYIRSEAKSNVKVTANGRQHQYSLNAFGVELPAMFLYWSKVSGSEDIKINANGKATIPPYVMTGKAVIQAAMLNPYGGPAKVIFQQEITMTNGNGQLEPKQQIKLILEELDTKLADIRLELAISATDEQKAKLIVDTVRAGSEAAKGVDKTKASNADKAKAVKDIKKKVDKLLTEIIRDLMDF
jgi:hypothetical protein